MVAFIAVIGMLACAIAVGLSSDCNITPGIIGMVTSLFLIICEVRFCRLRWHFAIFLNLLFNHTRSASILVWVYSSMCRVRRQDGSCHAEFHFQGTHVHRPWHCKLLLLLKYPASTPLSSKCSISLSLDLPVLIHVARLCFETFAAGLGCHVQLSPRCKVCSVDHHLEYLPLPLRSALHHCPH